MATCDTMATTATISSRASEKGSGMVKRPTMKGMADTVEAARKAMTIQMLLSVRRSLRTLVTAAPERTPDMRPASSPDVSWGRMPCMSRVSTVPATAPARASMPARPGFSCRSNHAKSAAKSG